MRARGSKVTFLALAAVAVLVPLVTAQTSSTPAGSSTAPQQGEQAYQKPVADSAAPQPAAAPSGAVPQSTNPDSTNPVSNDQPAVRKAKGSSHGSEGAQEQEKDEEAEFKLSPSVQWVARKTGLSLAGAYWLSFIFNFLVVAFVILWLMKLNLPGFFRGRSDQISKGIADARRASEEATRRLAEVEARLARLDADIAALHAQAEDSARVEGERILAAQEEEKRKIVESAQQEIAAAALNARRELKIFAGDLAINLAEKKVAVSAAADKTLVSTFTAGIGKERVN